MRRKEIDVDDLSDCSVIFIAIITFYYVVKLSIVNGTQPESKEFYELGRRKASDFLEKWR